MDNICVGNRFYFVLRMKVNKTFYVKLHEITHAQCSLKNPLASTHTPKKIIITAFFVVVVRNFNINNNFF